MSPVSASSARMPTSVDKTLRALQALAGHEVHGLSPADLAERLKVAPSWISQVMPALEAEHWVERIPDTGRWRLGVAPVRIGLTAAQHLQRARTELDSLTSRYLGSAQ
ncbi:IclR family transcriptional regulator [Vitreoscilla filiformis]|nr:Rrf2 family transcriptional regulator [Vitreoscilla filiformis]